MHSSDQESIDDSEFGIFRSIHILPTVVQFFAPAVSFRPPGVEAKVKDSNAVKLCQSFGCKVVVQVGSVKEGVEAMDYGVDCIIAQGSEAGG